MSRIGSIAALNPSLFIIVADATRAASYSEAGVRDLVVALSQRSAFRDAPIGVARLEFDGTEHPVIALQLEVGAGYATVHALGANRFAVFGPGEEYLETNHAAATAVAKASRAIAAGPSKKAKLAGTLEVGKHGLFVGESSGIGVAAPRKRADVVELEENGSLVVKLAPMRYAVLVEPIPLGDKSGGLAFILPADDPAGKSAAKAAVVTDADEGDDGAGGTGGEHEGASEAFAVENGGARLVLVSRGYTKLPEALLQHTHARELDAHYNQISELPDWIDRFTELRVLNLHQNQLATLPVALTKLRKLESLGLGKNALTALPAAFGALSKLKSLELADNPRLRELPPTLFELKRLEELDLSKTGLRALPEDVAKLAALRELDLRGTKVTALPAGFAALPRLEMLHVSKKVSVPLSLAKMTRPGRKDLKVLLQY